MNILIYTYEMHQGAEHLMPWRMLLEVAREMQQQGHKVLIASASIRGTHNDRIHQKIKIIHICSGINILADLIKREASELLFFPLAFRDGLKSFSEYKSIGIRKTGYIPGGVYPIKGIMSLIAAGGILSARPYLTEALTPRKLLLRKVSKAGFDTLIAFSDFTAQKTVNAGWERNKMFVSLPGFSKPVDCVNCISGENENYLPTGKYYLYAGSSSAIRGCLHLLKAFDKWADKQQDARLVMLIRKDKDVSVDLLKAVAARVRNKARLTVIYENMSPSQIQSYLKSAYAVVLPFLLVPSEIPITYYEAFSFGVPVITFKNGGTYHHVRNAVVASSGRGIKALSSMMHELWNNEIRRNLLSIEATKLIKTHPTWEESARVWIKCLDR